MSRMRSFSLVALAGAVVAGGILVAGGRGVSAQTGGTITGQITWCSPVPLPAGAGAGGGVAPSMPGDVPNATTPEGASPSTGPVEGHITRVKLIKRAGYGRAKLPLLRARVLGPN